MSGAPVKAGWTVASRLPVAPGVEQVELRRDGVPPMTVALAHPWPMEGPLGEPGWWTVAETVDRYQDGPIQKGEHVATTITTTNRRPATREEAWEALERLAKRRQAKTGESLSLAVLEVESTPEGRELREAYYTLPSGEGDHQPMAKAAPDVVTKAEARAWESIERAAQDLRSRDLSLTREQAIAKAVEIEPALADAYRRTIGAG